ncbi:MAG: EAL domain-containing protein [Phycisphaerae bacterium]
MQDGLSDILQLADMLRLSDEEHAALQRHVPTLTQHVEAFVDHFYAWLGSTPATANFLAPLPPEHLDRLKGHLAEHYRMMLSEHLDPLRAEKLAALGQFHHRLGLSISWISASYAVFAQDLNQVLLDIPLEDREILRNAIYKRLHLDEGWHLAGYRRAHMAGIQLRDGFYEAIRITNQVLSSHASVSALLHAVVHTLARHLKLPLVWVGTVDPYTKWVHIRAAAGPANHYARKLRIYSEPTCAEGRGPGGKALVTGAVVVTDWREANPSITPWIERIRHFGITGSMCAPFKIKNGQQGLLSIYSSDAAPFPVGAEELLVRLAADISVALDRIKNDRALKRLQSYQHALEQANRILLTDPAPEEMYQLLSKTILECTDALLAYVSVIDAENNRAHIITNGSVDGMPMPATVSIDPTKPEGWGLTGQVYRLNAPVTIIDARHDPHLAPWMENAKKYRHGGVAGFPIHCVDGHPEAVLVVVSRQGSYFTRDIHKLLTQLVNNTSVALESHRQRRRLEYMSIHDPLTGLPNRAYFEQTTVASLGRVDRTGNFLAIGIMDLDNFKETNDTLGHAAGDDLLKTVASRLSGALRAGDAAARLGGDEFGLLFNLKSPEDLTEAANRLLDAVQQPIQWGDEVISVGARLGFTVYPLDKADRTGLLRHADAALYNAKEGQHPIQIFESVLAERIEKRFRIRQSFPAALAGGKIECFLQPQANMRTGKLEGVELLARWHDGDSWISPGEFIPIIEGDPGLIRELDRFIISQALALRKNMSASGMDITISVNIGAAHLLRPDFLGDLDKLIGTSTDHSFLRLEITEGSALKNISLAISRLAAIKSRGLSTSLDDFGTGYASLLYAASLPVQELKLDQEFIRGLLNNPSHLAVAISTIQFARISDMSLIAEGVETQQELDTWMRLGGERIQGAFLAKAMPTTEFLPWVRHLQLTENRYPPVYLAEDYPLLAKQVARSRQLRLLRLLRGLIPPADDDPTRWPVPAFKECPLTHWIENRRSRYGKLEEFQIADAEHRLLHQRYDSSPAEVGVQDMTHWTQRLDDLVKAIDHELLRNSNQAYT